MLKTGLAEESLLMPHTPLEVLGTDDDDDVSKLLFPWSVNKLHVVFLNLPSDYYNV